jgi:hypothetical protein
MFRQVDRVAVIAFAFVSIATAQRPFGSEQFTNRRKAYGLGFNLDGIYTPQLGFAQPS